MAPIEIEDAIRARTRRLIEESDDPEGTAYLLALVNMTRAPVGIAGCHPLSAIIARCQKAPVVAVSRKQAFEVAVSTTSQSFVGTKSVEIEPSSFERVERVTHTSKSESASSKIPRAYDNAVRPDIFFTATLEQIHNVYDTAMLRWLIERWSLEDVLPESSSEAIIKKIFETKVYNPINKIYWKVWAEGSIKFCLQTVNREYFPQKVRRIFATIAGYEDRLSHFSSLLKSRFEMTVRPLWFFKDVDKAEFLKNKTVGDEIKHLWQVAADRDAEVTKGLAYLHSHGIALTDADYWVFVMLSLVSPPYC